MSSQPASDVIICNFRKSDMLALPRSEKTGVRLGKSVLPPVMFLQDGIRDDVSELDGLFVRSLLSDHIHSLTIED